MVNREWAREDLGGRQASPASEPGEEGKAQGPGMDLEGQRWRGCGRKAKDSGGIPARHLLPRVLRDASDKRPQLILGDRDSRMQGSQGSIVVTCWCLINYSKTQHLKHSLWVRKSESTRLDVSGAGPLGRLQSVSARTGVICRLEWHCRIHFHCGPFTWLTHQ